MSEWCVCADITFLLWACVCVCMVLYQCTNVRHTSKTHTRTHSIDYLLVGELVAFLWPKLDLERRTLMETISRAASACVEVTVLCVLDVYVRLFDTFALVTAAESSWCPDRRSVERAASVQARHATGSATGISAAE